MTTSHEKIRIGESAIGRCIPGQVQYNSRYLRGDDGLEVLGAGLDFEDNLVNYHAIRIKPSDACILAGRIVKHRVKLGVICETEAPLIPCDDCPFKAEVFADLEVRTE